LSSPSSSCPSRSSSSPLASAPDAQNSTAAPRGNPALKQSANASTNSASSSSTAPLGEVQAPATSRGEFAGSRPNRALTRASSKRAVSTPVGSNSLSL